MIRRYTLIGVSGEDVKLRRCGDVVLCISCVFNFSGETVIGNVRFFSEEFNKSYALNSFLVQVFLNVLSIVYVGVFTGITYVRAKATTCACRNMHCVSMPARYAYALDVKKRCSSNEPIALFGEGDKYSAAARNDVRLPASTSETSRCSVEYDTLLGRK